MQHELACLFVVGKLANDSKVVGRHILVMLNCWTIWDGVFVLSVTTVKNPTDFSCNLACSMHSKILQIIGNPTSVYKYGILFPLCIKMCVKWSYYLNAALSSVPLFNLELFLVIENSLDGDWFERPFAFKLIDIFGVRPQKLGLVLRSDVNWSFFHLFCSSSGFMLFVFLVSVLVFGKLLNEN